MPTACINQPDCRVHLKSERLEVHGRNPQTQREELLREIPLRDLDRLIVTESAQVASAALAAVLRADIPVNFLAWNGQFLGGFLPATNRHGLARLRQYQRTLDPAFALQMAGRVITAKIYNQRRVLQRLKASRAAQQDPARPVRAQQPRAPGQAVPTSTPQTPANPSLAVGAPFDGQKRGDGADEQIEAADGPGGDLEAALGWLDGLFASLKQCRTIDELRGYEGAATARYFQAWARLLPPAFPFERRSTRPPLNPVNACISFGATLVYSEAVAFLHAHGLDPSLGLLHATEDGRWSLALDLIEPFRPALVEALALDLFSHEILNAKHFEPKNGGVYLNEEGRKKFFLQYERRMERQFLSEAVAHRTTLRQQLENQALMFKAALEDDPRFEPFLMN
ncbi:MAG: CRISPR-associated endonuclease Cas1 [Limisphaerales bacterium]